MTSATSTRRQREVLLVMTEGLVAEFADRLPAGTVMRVVARCHTAAVLHGLPGAAQPPALEQVARAQLLAVASARVVT